MIDIVELLKMAARNGNALAGEAADEIERLRQQISLLNGHDTLAQFQAHIDEQASEIERLRADNARLKAALNKIMRNDPEGYEASIARAAL